MAHTMNGHNFHVARACHATVATRGGVALCTLPDGHDLPDHVDGVTGTTWTARKAA